MNTLIFRIVTIPFLFLLPSAIASATTVVLNEFQASNGQTIADEDGDFEDWIELYNHGEEPVFLGGYGLSDDEERPFRWVFPDITLGPGEFLLVFASNKDRTDGPFLHTNFAISSGGEELLLTAPDGALLDFVPPTAVPRDISHGRQPDGTGEWYFFEDPTPGTANATNAYLGILEPPVFSHEAGFYDAPFELDILTDDPDAIVRVTLDGETPGPAGDLYEGSILIVNRNNEPNTLSMIPTDYSPWETGVEWPGPIGLVRKAMVVRARAEAPGKLSSPVVTQTYFVDDDFYARNDIAVVSLSVNYDDFFGHERGIHVRGHIFDHAHEFWEDWYPNFPAHNHPGNFHQRGRQFVDLSGVTAQPHGDSGSAIPSQDHGFPRNFSYLVEAPQITITGTTHYDGIHYLSPDTTDSLLVLDHPYEAETFPDGAMASQDWERPIHFELFDETGERVVAEDLGVRIHGATSRRTRQKTLRFYARNEYGNETVEHNLIPSTETSSYKRFLLRKATEFSGLNDILGQRILRLLNPRIETQEFRHAIVFINGEYWGWKTFRDRYDSWHLALTHDLPRDEIAMVSGSSGTLEWGTPLDASDFHAMDEFIRTADLSIEENAALVHEWMDVDAYLDYMAGGIYLNYGDWFSKHLMAWRYTGTDTEDTYPRDGRWRWMAFDLDGGLGREGDASVDYLHNVLRTQDYFLADLLENEGMRHTFINRLADWMNSLLHENNAQHLFEQVRAGVPDEVVQESINRFRNSTGSFDVWQGYKEDLKAYLPNRPPHMRAHLINQFDLEGAVDITVGVSGPTQGTVRVNSVHISSDTPGLLDSSQPYPWSGVYFQGVPVEVEAVPAPGYRFVGWQGLKGVPAERVFTVIPQGDLAFTAMFEKDPAIEAAIAGVHPSGQANWPLPPITVEALTESGDRDTLFEGTFVATVLEGPGEAIGTLSATAESGRARFEGIVLDRPGTYRLQFEAEGLAPAVTDIITVAAIEARVLPLFIQGRSPDNTDRVPFVYRARIAGLLPGTTYRYANRVVTIDEPALQNGAGNSLLPTADHGAFRRNLDTPDFSDPDTYAEFTTDGSGVHEGWFVTEPSGNARFGEQALRMRILLNDGAEGENYYYYLTVPEPVTVLDFGAGADEGTALWGAGPFTPRDPVFLYGQSTGGGRPLAGTLVEATGAEVDARYAAFYELFAAGQDRHWGTIIPNTLPGGVRRVEERSWSSGEVSAVHLSADGRWPGGMDTVNPSGGTAPLALSLPEGPADPAVAVAGVVRDSNSLEGVACAVVELTAGDGSFRVTSVTDENGAYFVEPLPEGDYSVRVYAPGFEPHVADSLALVDGGARIEQDHELVALTAAEALAGRVTEAESGQPLVSVWVEVFADDAFLGETFTCASGHYALSLTGIVDETPVTVFFTLANFATAERTESIGGAGGGLIVDEALFPLASGAARIEGQVLTNGMGEDASLEDARVTLRGPINISTGTGPGGAYDFENLLGGSYAISASAAGYTGQWRQRLLEAGESAMEVFLLDREPPAGIPGDVNGDGVVNAVDVQLVINAALGIAIDADFNADINGDGVVNAVDVQLVINAALGIDISGQL